jgi:hypothetical protein
VQKENRPRTSKLLNCFNRKFAFQIRPKMVKKRVRDADLLQEAPAQSAAEDDESGSDEVSFLFHPKLTFANVVGC